MQTQEQAPCPEPPALTEGRWLHDSVVPNALVRASDVLKGGSGVALLVLVAGFCQFIQPSFTSVLASIKGPAVLNRGNFASEGTSGSI